VALVLGGKGKCCSGECVVVYCITMFASVFNIELNCDILPSHEYIYLYLCLCLYWYFIAFAFGFIITKWQYHCYFSPTFVYLNIKMMKQYFFFLIDFEYLFHFGQKYCKVFPLLGLFFHYFGWNFYSQQNTNDQYIQDFILHIFYFATRIIQSYLQTSDLKYTQSNFDSKYYQ
jgi:hypothetical protein